MEGGENSWIVGPLSKECRVVDGWMVSWNMDVGIFNAKRSPERIRRRFV